MRIKRNDRSFYELFQIREKFIFEVLHEEFAVK